MTALLTPARARLHFHAALRAAAFPFSDLAARLSVVSSAAMADVWSKLLFFFLTEIESLPFA